MTRSCYHPTRGYCFCEFCIAAHLKNAYVQANNSPKQPINFKNYKKSIELSPLEIYCKQFSTHSSAEQSIKLTKRAYTKTPLNSPNQLNKTVDLNVNDNQIKFLRILSDRLTQLAEQQTQYILSTNGSQTNNLNASILNSTLLRRRARVTRLRSSISESSGYETCEPINESPLPNATFCNSAGMLFNTTGLEIKQNISNQKNRIKFGPEDILATTNPMLLFDSNLIDESAFLKRSSRRKRKSIIKTTNATPVDNAASDIPTSQTAEKNDMMQNSKSKDSKSTNLNKLSSGKAFSDVTNTIKNTVSSTHTPDFHIHKPQNSYAIKIKPLLVRRLNRTHWIQITLFHLHTLMYKFQSFNASQQHEIASLFLRFINQRKSSKNKIKQHEKEHDSKSSDEIC